MPNAHRPMSVPLGGLLALALASCAHHPNPNLVRAESDVRAAEEDPLVARNAPLLLRDARAALDRGRQAERRDAGDGEVDHLAYVASRRAEIARAAAQKQADVRRAEQLAREADALVVVPPATEPSVSVEDVFFEPERSRLTEAARVDLAHVAEVIIAHPERSVRIDGYADESEREGLDLGERRASEVARALIEDGVSPGRIATRSFGATAPVASGTTAAGRQRNRRVEIVLDPTFGAG